MTVFEVDKTHIDLIVWAAVRNSPEPEQFQGHSADELGQILTDANRYAVINLYDLPRGDAPKYVYEPPHSDAWSLGEILKALICLEHQLDEIEGYSKSQAGRLINAIRERVIFQAAPETWHITRLSLPMAVAS